MIWEDLCEKSQQKVRALAHEYYKNNRPQSSLATISGLSMDVDEPERPRHHILNLSDNEDQ